EGGAVGGGGRGDVVVGGGGGECPKLVAPTACSRRPRIARPRSSSLWPKPYMSDESRKFTPRSSARFTTSIDCASSCLPYVPDIDMHPRPSAGTESELWPSWR